MNTNICAVCVYKYILVSLFTRADGWLNAENSEGRRGFVPSTFLEGYKKRTTMENSVGKNILHNCNNTIIVNSCLDNNILYGNELYDDKIFKDLEG